MMRRRKLAVLIGVLVVTGAIAFIVYWHWHAPPEAVRLLPESDTVLYVDLRPVRLAVGTGASEPEDPDYRQFVAETGFDFKRDLDQVAMGVVAPNWATQGPLPPPDTRSSEVLVGRFDAQKVGAYLKKMARSVDTYREIEIYSIPHEGRTVRVAIVAVNEVAITNVDDPETIRGMIDRARRAAAPFAGPELVQKYYKDVPFGSMAWGVARIPASVGGDSMPALPLQGGVSMGAFPPGSVIVASLRYKLGIAVQAATITPSEQEAQQIADKLAAYLAIFRSLQASSAVGPDPDVKKLFDSLRVERRENRVVVQARVPPGFIQKALSGPPPVAAPQPEEKPQPEEQPKKKAGKKK